ncbi:HPr kinase/phosphorylase [Metabacillus idriensis]|uniref:HPr kinase/phosphorylase n=1 Tax=Metabacillus idriensis TaxID=324768 RepID=UPI00174D69E7|nr:aldolase [Metabacillus idriensis]
MKKSIPKKYHFNAFGFNILSDIHLPELPQIPITSNDSGIFIEKSDLSSLWEALASDNQFFYIKEDLIMFRIPDNAIYMIQEGKEIFYSPFENAKEDHLRLYLLGTCMGALLLQRKILPLHGSAIAIEGKAYAIVGDSGAGKSTLASAMLKRGYQLISDDVIPITLNEKNTPIVTPAYPQQKLWLDSLNQFGMKSNQYRPIIDRETKFAISITNQFVSKPLPLAGVFELVKSEKDEMKLNPIQSLHRIHTLFNHTYRNFFIAPSGLMKWHFSTTVKMCEDIDIYKLSRPTSRFTAHNLTDLILSAIEKEKKLYG